MISVVSAMLTKAASLGVAAKTSMAVAVVATSTATAGAAGVLPEPMQQPFDRVVQADSGKPAEAPVADKDRGRPENRATPPGEQAREKGLDKKAELPEQAADRAVEAVSKAEERQQEARNRAAESRQQPRSTPAKPDSDRDAAPTDSDTPDAAEDRGPSSGRPSAR